MDAGNYTMVLTNKITREEQRRSFQLLVNGMYSLFFSVSSWAAWCCWSRDSGANSSSVFSYSASSYHWEGGGSGHWCIPVWQQPHPKVHRSWISHSCTHPVAVDVQRGLSRGLPVSHLSSGCVCVCESQRANKGGLPFVCVHSVHMLLSHSLSTGCWFRSEIAAFVMLTKTNGETMSAHSDPMHISGCDSCSSQCHIFSESDINYSKSVCVYWFCAIRDFLPQAVCLCGSAV